MNMKSKVGDIEFDTDDSIELLSFFNGLPIEDPKHERTIVYITKDERKVIYVCSTGGPETSYKGEWVIQPIGTTIEFMKNPRFAEMINNAQYKINKYRQDERMRKFIDEHKMYLLDIRLLHFDRLLDAGLIK